MRRIVLAIGVMCANTLALAQNPVAPQSYGVEQTTLGPDVTTSLEVRTLTPEEAQQMMDRAGVNACPVSLRARQSSAAFARQVGDGQDVMRPDGAIGQRLKLTIADRGSKRVVGATVTVRGYTNKSRMMETRGDDRGNAAKTLDVRFAAVEGQQTTAEVAVPGFTGVKSVEVNSVTYSDGTSWKLAGGNACLSPVDGLMLVSGR